MGKKHVLNLASLFLAGVAMVGCQNNRQAWQPPPKALNQQGPGLAQNQTTGPNGQPVSQTGMNGNGQKYPTTNPNDPQALGRGNLGGGQPAGNLNSSMMTSSGGVGPLQVPTPSATNPANPLRPVTPAPINPPDP